MENLMQIALSGIGAIFSCAVTYFGYKMKKHDEERQKKEDLREQMEIAMREGLCSVLRYDLIRACHHYHEKGYAPTYAMETVTGMYDAYHKLGGNGAITGIYKQFLLLPHKISEP